MKLDKLRNRFQCNITEKFTKSVIFLFLFKKAFKKINIPLRQIIIFCGITSRVICSINVADKRN